MARRIAIAALLVGAVLTLYAPVDGYPFASIDDSLYVTGNPRVQAGLDLDGLRWALTSTSDGNWLPATWLSHMLDVELYGLDAGRHHRTSRWLHALNAALVFAALVAMTGRAAPAALVAALFALHPLRVESVAWVAERKDVLSGTFALLAIAAHASFARTGGAARRAGVIAALAVGLMAKSMLVTLPFVLLLLDVWPLGRVAGARADAGALERAIARWGGAERPGRFRAAPLADLVREKLPLFALVAAASAITFAAQEGRGAMVVGGDLAAPERVANAVVAFARYASAQLWPVGLASQVPHPFLPMEGGQGLGAGQVVGALALLGALTAGALAAGRAVGVGWLWFLGMLVPVSGIVQVGPYALADRYTYLPSIGFWIAVVFGVGAPLAARVGRSRGLRRAGAAAIAAAIALLALASALQIRTWRDSLAIYRRSLEVDPGNLAAHFSLAGEYRARGEDALALAHYRAVLARQPRSARAWNGLGVVLHQLGRDHEAAGALERALALQPGLALAHNQLGNVYRDLGRLDDAERAYRDALRAEPSAYVVRLNLGNLLRDAGRDDEALALYEEAVALRPSSGKARHTLAELLAQRGDVDAARAQYEAILAVDPLDAEARVRLRRLARDGLGSAP